MRKSWEVDEKNHEKVIRKLQNKSWESNEKVIRKKKVRESHGKVIIKSWKSHEKVIIKSWESHKKIMKNSWDESNIPLRKTVENDNTILKNNPATVNYKSPEKPSIQKSSEAQVTTTEADRQLYFKTLITSVEALKTEISRFMETDGSNGMINLYCKICGQRKQTKLRLHIGTHLNINLPCALCNKVFNSNRKLTAHTLQFHGKTYAESQKNVHSVSTKTELPVDNSKSKKAKSQYLRTFVNKDTGEKVQHVQS